MSFALFRSILDLLLPKALAFKVTPKGVLEARLRRHLLARHACRHRDQRHRDRQGPFRVLVLRHRERCLLLQPELGRVEIFRCSCSRCSSPGRGRSGRREERIPKRVPIELSGLSGLPEICETCELSLTGFSLLLPAQARISGTVTARLAGEFGFAAPARAVNSRPASRSCKRVGFEWVSVTEEQRERLVLGVDASPDTWKDAHDLRARSSLGMIWLFVLGIIRCLVPLRALPGQARPRPGSSDRGTPAVPVMALRDERAESAGFGPRE